MSFDFGLLASKSPFIKKRAFFFGIVEFYVGFKPAPIYSEPEK